MRVILYTKDFNENINEPVDVILSPQYYWIKKIDIPIKTLKDAKKLSKTLFKLDESYIYDAFETENKFYAFAIQKNLSLNIDKKFINSVRLAQTELFKYDKINVSEHHSIQKIDDLLFCFPNTQDAPDINEILPEIKLSKNKINLYNRINIDKSVIFYVAAVFLLINSVLAINYFKNRSALQELSSQKNSLLKEYKLPKTSFQLKSILNELKQNDTVQKKIRKNLEFITKTPLKKGEKFLNLKYDKNFIVEIQSKRNLDFYFKKHFKVKSSLKDGIYKAELNE